MMEINAKSNITFITDSKEEIKLELSIEDIEKILLRTSTDYPVVDGYKIILRNRLSVKSQFTDSTEYPYVFILVDTKKADNEIIVIINSDSILTELLEDYKQIVIMNKLADISMFNFEAGLDFNKE